MKFHVTLFQPPKKVGNDVILEARLESIVEADSGPAAITVVKQSIAVALPNKKELGIFWEERARAGFSWEVKECS